MHVLHILHQCGNKGKTKSHKVFGIISIFDEVTGEKLVGGLFGIPIMNRVKNVVLSSS